MIQNILNDIIKVLRGKNGTMFLIIGAVVLVIFFLQILGPLLKFAIIGGLIYLVFKYLENQKSEK